MSQPTINLLLEKLQQCGLACSSRIRIAEKVLICLYILTGFSNRAAQERFQHIGETISRITCEVLVALSSIQNAYVAQSPSLETPQAIRRNPKWYPFFENCLGAIDGTHIPATVSSLNQSRFRDRNGDLSQNVFAACTFDMRFCFVLAGWEGSAHDGRVLNDAYTKGFEQQSGRYYLGDAGYALSPWVLTPYRGVRVIERTFGVVKKRFPILVDMPAYPYQRQVDIVIATFILHNFIRTHQGYNDEYDNVTHVEQDHQRQESNGDENDSVDSVQAAAMRDTIAPDMWASYCAYNSRKRS
ncbi:hypothetical protein Ae201684P_006934 [Aphanomyces euteiches]|nr:hypothetical protein Ae201684P_006934 [Aphanomyces euteiches]